MLHVHNLQGIRSKEHRLSSYRTQTSRHKICSSISLQRSSRTATRSIHLSRALSIELLQCRIALVLHNSSLLEICDLSTKSAQVRCRPGMIQSSPIVSSSIRPRSSTPNCTYPATCASALKFPQLRRTSLPRLLVFPHAVDDAVAIQALEEAVAAIPALCAGAAIGCYEAAVL
jgi:hypothetical protein